MRDFKTPFSPGFLENYQKGVMGYRYKGIPCLKSPLDLAIYMQLLWVQKPQTIIEIGAKFGGSAQLFSDLTAVFKLDCSIVSIDIDLSKIGNPEIDRVLFLQGDVHHLEAVFEKNGLFQLPRPWFVVEDSAHTYKACKGALEFFSATLQPGEMLAMEDGILSEIGLDEMYEGGPNRAIREFMEQHPGVFKVEETYCDMFGRNATYNPNGYLRKMP